MSEQVVHKPAGVAETFGLSWLRFIVESWGSERRYVAGDIVRPPVGNGWFYTASLLDAGDTFGMSSKLTPNFLPGAGEVTSDGSMIWTAGRPGSLSLVAIDTSVWTLDAGIVEDSKSIVGFDTNITVSGGIEGEQYRMVNLITKATGEEEEDSLVLEIIAPKDV